MEEVEQTKVKCALTAGIHWENPLNIKLDTDNKGQYCKIGVVCVGGEGEGTSGKGAG
jgi:hypothetical protein